MEYAHLPTPVSIDKICMFNYDFSLKKGNSLTTLFGQYPGDETMYEKKKYYNEPNRGTVEVLRDKQGRDVCRLTFNPNKVGMDACIDLCKGSGVNMNLGGCNLLRLDIARDNVLQYDTKVYHDVFQYSMSGRVDWSVSHGTTIRVHNTRSEIGFYNKSIESNLPTPGVHRLEVRLVKPTYIRKAGIITFADLLQYDTDMLLEIYRQNGLRILPRLMRKEGSLDNIGNMVATLEQLYTVSKRPFVDFLSTYGIIHSTPETILTVIQASNLPKQKKYRARLQLNEHLSKLNGSVSFVQQEIINYFAA